MHTRTTEQRAPAGAVADHERSFANKLLEMLAVPTFVLDIDCKVMLWNRACERLTGVPSCEVLGRGDHWRSFYDAPRPILAELVLQQRTAEAAQLFAHPPKPSEASNALEAEGWCDMPRTGRRRYLAADASPIFDEDGALVAAVQTLRDLTEEKMARRALEQMALRDGLTGLANRRCFDDTLQAEWLRARRQESPLSLLMVDVDHFKAYNDAHGHLGGDACLKRIASAIASEMRANDLVARYGGEEFAVILPNQTLAGAASVAERIRCRVERLHMPNSGSCAQQVTVSIGAATTGGAPDTNASALIGIADAALYRAKHLGRNRVSLPLSATP